MYIKSLDQEITVNQKCKTILQNQIVKLIKSEHFALNFTQPHEMSAIHKKHLGLTLVKKMDETPFMIFLTYDSGTIMPEIYTNSKGTVLDFQSKHPLVVHLAFVSADPTFDKDRLLAAGASLFSDDQLADDSHLVMLRDPWGLAIQFCKKAVPMLR